MLHPSLTDLAAQAPLSGTEATARGVLAESRELLRNALDHRAVETELSSWYSTLLADTLRCPAAGALVGDAGVLPTGDVGRGDATPASAVTWLTVTPVTVDADPSAPLAELVSSVGLPVAPPPATLPPTTSAEWAARAEVAVVAGDADILATLADAGLPGVAGPQPALLERAVRCRPQAVRSADGLPDRSTPVDVPADILTPVADVARWASLAADSPARSTPERLAAARAGGWLADAEVDALEQARATGLALQYRRWADRVDTHPATLGDLTALDRTAYGAAARMVAGVIRSVATRHGVPLSDA